MSAYSMSHSCGGMCQFVSAIVGVGAGRGAMARRTRRAGRGATARRTVTGWAAMARRGRTVAVGRRGIG